MILTPTSPGLHLSVFATLIKQTLLNPTLTLPLFLLTQYSNNGRAFALDHPIAARRLKTLMYLGIVRFLNGYLNRGAQNNWTSATPQWDKELVVVTGGSDGMGRLLVGKFAEKGVKVVVLDIQEVTGLDGELLSFLNLWQSTTLDARSLISEIAVRRPFWRLSQPGRTDPGRACTGRMLCSLLLPADTAFVRYLS